MGIGRTADKQQGQALGTQQPAHAALCGPLVCRRYVLVHALQCLRLGQTAQSGRVWLRLAHHMESQGGMQPGYGIDRGVVAVLAA